MAFKGLDKGRGKGRKTANRPHLMTTTESAPARSMQLESTTMIEVTSPSSFSRNLSIPMEDLISTHTESPPHSIQSSASSSPLLNNTTSSISSASLASHSSRLNMNAAKLACESIHNGNQRVSSLEPTTSVSSKRARIT